ncbi:MAG: hypothetical protein HOP33_04415 [Verrucomicrobia bacterium]|nr:hypothetical protein [Verrucomicrobiota bacterium]
MDALSSKVAGLLKDKNIGFYSCGHRIRIPLPSGFGEIEIGELDDGDTIFGLVDNAWHTHGESLIPDYGDDIAPAMVNFLELIFSGQLKMVEFQLAGQEPRRVIEDDLESFLKYKQPGEKLTVFDHAGPLLR